MRTRVGVLAIVLALTGRAFGAVIVSVTSNVNGAVTQLATLDHQDLTDGGTNVDPLVPATHGGTVVYGPGKIVGSITASAGVVKGFSGSYESQTGSSIDYSTVQSSATIMDGLPVPGTGPVTMAFSIGLSGTISTPISAGSGSLDAELGAHLMVEDLQGNTLLYLHYDNFAASGNVLSGTLTATGGTTLQLDYDFTAFTYDNGISGYGTAEIDFSHTAVYHADDLTNPGVDLIGTSGFDYATAAPEPAGLGCLGMAGILWLRRRVRE